MNPTGGNDDLLVRARSVLLDALIALDAHRDSVVVIGAQAPQAGQPGSWLSPGGIPVDLMVPDAIAGKGRRSVEAPPHDRRALLRAVGLEAAVIDNAMVTIRALDADDDRVVAARVASPAALLVAKREIHSPVMQASAQRSRRTLAAHMNVVCVQLA